MRGRVIHMTEYQIIGRFHPAGVCPVSGILTGRDSFPRVSCVVCWVTIDTRYYGYQIGWDGSRTTSINIMSYKALCNECARTRELIPLHEYVISPCGRFELYGIGLICDFRHNKDRSRPDDRRFLDESDQFSRPVKL